MFDTGAAGQRSCLFSDPNSVCTAQTIEMKAFCMNTSVCFLCNSGLSSFMLMDVRQRPSTLQTSVNILCVDNLTVENSCVCPKFQPAHDIGGAL